jgi:predicted transcriptional regulator
MANSKEPSVQAKSDGEDLAAVTFRYDRQKLDRLKLLARQNHRTISGILRGAIDDYISAQEAHVE